MAVVFSSPSRFGLAKISRMGGQLLKSCMHRRCAAGWAFPCESRLRSGEQPLHVSAMYGTLDVARLLLEHGAQVDALTHTGQSALLLAASMGAADDDGGNSGSSGGGDGDGTKFVDMLLESGADARRAWRNGATALHEASARGRLGMVQRLLAAGARADAVDAYGDSPLHWAAASGAVNVTRALLEWLGLDGYRAELAHHSASASLSALAEPSAPPTSSAPANGSKPPRLRSRQLPFNQYGASPLHVAAFNGHVATLEVLLQTAAGQSAVGVADIFGETAVQVAPSAEARAVLLQKSGQVAQDVTVALAAATNSSGLWV